MYLLRAAPQECNRTLQRNLLYADVTRSKRLVVLVGQPRAVTIEVRGVAGRRRWSKLREWLAAGVPGEMS